MERIMKVGYSLEMINLRTSGPNQLYMQSRSYWIEMLKYISAAGFTGIEMPYNPYSGDPVTLEIGRCGVPISRFAVESQYGGVESFCTMLHEFGIKDIVGIHINANDTMLDLIARFRNKEELFQEFYNLAEEAIDFAAEAKVPVLVVSPTPEIGYVSRYYTNQEFFEKEIMQTLSSICELARSRSIKVTIKNEFWSLYRGRKVETIYETLPDAYYSPDMAHLMIAGEDPVSVIKNMGARILLPRFSDTDFIDESNNYQQTNAETPLEGKQRMFCDMGSGTVNFIEISSVLEKQGYDGYVVCDCKKTMNVYKALLKMRWYMEHKILR